MSLFSHNIYDNVRTRVIVIYRQSLLLHPPCDTASGWLPPGGGLEPNESLADCAVREVWEETGGSRAAAPLAKGTESRGDTIADWDCPQCGTVICGTDGRPNGNANGANVSFTVR